MGGGGGRSSEDQEVCQVSGEKCSGCRPSHCVATSRPGYHGGLHGGDLQQERSSGAGLEVSDGRGGRCWEVRNLKRPTQEVVSYIQRYQKSSVCQPVEGSNQLRQLTDQAD